MNNLKIGSIFAVGFVVVVVAGYFAYTTLFNRPEIEEIPKDGLTKTSANISNAFIDAFNRNDFKTASDIVDIKLLANENDFNSLLIKAKLLAQQASLTFKEKELGDQALVYINKALSINASSSEALTIKGYIYEIQQDYTKAHMYYDMAIKLDPNNVDAISKKAHAYDLMGDMVNAEKLYEQALAKDLDQSYIAVQYSRLLLSKGKVEEAKALLLKNVESIKNLRSKAEAYYLLGNFYQENTYQEAANTYFTKSKDTDPSLPMAYVGLAQEKFKEGMSTSKTNKQLAADQMNEALSFLEIALKLNPNQSLASLELARQMFAISNSTFGMKVLQSLKLNIGKDITLSKGDKDWMKALVDELIKQNTAK